VLQEVLYHDFARPEINFPRLDEIVAEPLNDRATQITVLIIDKRSANRAGLRMALETEPDVQVVGEASTVAEALYFAKQHQPRVVILDLDLAGADAASTVRELIARCPACMVILLALFVDPPTHAELMSAGAAACVEKALPGNLLKAFRNARRQSSSPS
jgi:DNA-binding NarL/FixJ family response regulator